MTILGWKYVKRGSCAQCDNEWDRLHLPVIDKEHGNIVMFEPVCATCIDRYDITVTCKKCRSPMVKVKTAEGLKYDCLVCPSTGTLYAPPTDPRP